MAFRRRVEHEFPHLAVIGDSIRELHRGLTASRVSSYTASLAPAAATLRPGEDPLAGAQRIARALAEHLRLGDVRIVVSFAPLPHAGEIDIGTGPMYPARVNVRHAHEAGAVLAHEVTHVFLHLAGIHCADLGKLEFLTDTASVYLGAGWLILDAYRPGQSLGYLTPAELGYVLAKRALAFSEDPEPRLTTHAAAAYRTGLARARLDYEQAPLAAAGDQARQQYFADRAAGTARGYRLEGRDPVKVVFPCPVCHHLMRVAVGLTATVRCGVCRSTHACVT